eukprot:10059943-Lingulodinium_polyedra.AAC.1
MSRTPLRSTMPWSGVSRIALATRESPPAARTVAVEARCAARLASTARSGLAWPVIHCTWPRTL